MAVAKFKTDIPSAELEAMPGKAAAASDLLKALSHQSRLLIMCHLNEKELNVSEIEEIMDIPQAQLSQHLARLRLEGLVATRREGRTIYYRNANKEAKAVVKLLYQLFCK
ncbi:MAG: metalloregulator ArsR/SmtB family transcription factor [Granulosicoccaceae bacterium]